MKVSLFIKCLLLLVVSTLLFGCGKGDKKNDFKTPVYGDYRKAVEDGNFDKAYRLLADYRKEYLRTQSLNWSFNRDDRKEAEGLYYDAFDYIYKAEIRQILAEMDEKDAKDKIVFLLDQIPVEGQKFPQGLCEFSVAARGTWGDEGIPLDVYIIWTQHYNDLCNSVLTLAINRKYKTLAQQILMHFVDNVEATEGRAKVNGVDVDGDHGYINYVKTDYNNARKKYEEAVKLGLFD